MRQNVYLPEGLIQKFLDGKDLNSLLSTCKDNSNDEQSSLRRDQFF